MRCERQSARQLKDIGMQNKRSRLYVQVCKSYHLGFKILQHTALHTQCSKLLFSLGKVKCVVWFHEAKSVITVQRMF